MQKKEFPDQQTNAQNYSYRGPIPFSKETCVVMMADAVEAATRSIKSPTEQKINNLVDAVIAKHFDEGQFMNSNITLKDISLVKKLFKKRLLNIYHLRIEYPD
jgi:membrane-associated HD superfamily phosphohydrolase